MDKEKTNPIPRKSEFNLTDEEKTVLREINEKLKNVLSKIEGPEVSEEQIYNEIINKLYYDIGTDDYWIYNNVNSNQEDIETNTKRNLANRAIHSARLQVLLEDMQKKGFDIEKTLKFNAESKEMSESINIYHGTFAPIATDEIGKPDKKGVYSLKDGVSYWASDKNVAQGYIHPKYLNPELIDRGIKEKDGKIHQKVINESDECKIIPETHGGACFIWQDEFIKMNNDGVKYLFSRDKKRADILDISNFADFVQKRDGCILDTMKKYGLRLPEKSENLVGYLDGLGMRKIWDKEKKKVEEKRKDKISQKSNEKNTITLSNNVSKEAVEQARATVEKNESSNTTLEEQGYKIADSKKKVIDKVGERIEPKQEKELVEQQTKEQEKENDIGD